MPILQDLTINAYGRPHDDDRSARQKLKAGDPYKTYKLSSALSASQETVPSLSISILAAVTFLLHNFSSPLPQQLRHDRLSHAYLLGKQ